MGNTKTIKIDLDPQEKVWQSPGIKPYNFIDLNISEGTDYYTFLFGRDKEEKEILPGIWGAAIVKIEKAELVIPFSKFRNDKAKSGLFSISGTEKYILLREDAVKIAACFFLFEIINASSINGFCQYFVNIYGEDYLRNLHDSFKRDICSDKKIGKIAISLLGK